MSGFELLLFATDSALIERAVKAGIDGIIVDWEFAGKERRQTDADTQINNDTLEDLVRVRSATPGTVVCRINGFNPTTPEEIEAAVGAGADEILLPMVRSREEVTAALSIIDGRCKLGILVETSYAVANVDGFADLPLARVYVGLNDLAIDRGTPNIFTSIVDGTVERVGKAVRAPFGFAGLTLPERGYPIPCHLLMGELVRLGSGFSFLRRSFLKDTAGTNMSAEVGRIREALKSMAERSPEEIELDRAALEEAVARWQPRSIQADEVVPV
ncbi:MAG: aldolase/citrate lyase family protein [Candidatus Aquicultorales bacterium]